MSGLPRTIDLAGNQVPMLKVRDICALSAFQHETQRKRLIIAFAESGVSDAEKAKAISEHDKALGDVLTLMQWANTLHGATAIVEKACERNSIDANAVLAELDPLEITNRAARLIFKPVEGSAEGKELGGGDGSGTG